MVACSFTHAIVASAGINSNSTIPNQSFRLARASSFGHYCRPLGVCIVKRGMGVYGRQGRGWGLLDSTASLSTGDRQTETETRTKCRAPLIWQPGECFCCFEKTACQRVCESHLPQSKVLCTGWVGQWVGLTVVSLFHLRACLLMWIWVLVRVYHWWYVILYYGGGIG